MLLNPYQKIKGCPWQFCQFLDKHIDHRSSHLYNMDQKVVLNVSVFDLTWSILFINLEDEVWPINSIDILCDKVRFVCTVSMLVCIYTLMSLIPKSMAVYFLSTSCQPSHIQVQQHLTSALSQACMWPTKTLIIFMGNWLMSSFLRDTFK